MWDDMWHGRREYGPTNLDPLSLLLQPEKGSSNVPSRGPQEPGRVLRIGMRGWGVGVGGSLASSLSLMQGTEYQFRSPSAATWKKKRLFANATMFPPGCLDVHH